MSIFLSHPSPLMPNDEWVPEGYTPTGTLGTNALDYMLLAYSCGQAVIANDTVANDVAFVVTQTPVEVDPSLPQAAPSGLPQVLAFEIFASVGPLFERFVLAGVPVTVAEIRVATESLAPERSSVSVDGTLLYSVSSVGEYPEGTNLTDPARIHYWSGMQGSERYYDIVSSWEQGTLGGSTQAFLQTPGGRLGDVTASTGLGGVHALYHGDMDLTFGMEASQP